MIKIKGQLGFSEKDLEDYIKSNFDKAFQKTVAETSKKIQEHASSRLKGGLAHWNKGFSVDQISKDTFILTMSGKLASMMEDGIGVGEISKMIMQGNRATYNKGQGKDYVDVPIPKSAVKSVQVFRDADSLMKQFSQKKIKFSDVEKGGVKEEDRYLRRVKDLIESKKHRDSSSQFMVIRRVTESSVWPKQQFAGAKAFEAGTAQISKDFEEILRRVF